MGVIAPSIKETNKFQVVPQSFLLHWFVTAPGQAIQGKK